jgi:catechol 2,3-dioxygenase-like lactoylglutathione lyase family enzyme
MRPHISLDVRNVSRSVEFYRKVFGTEPQKQSQNYAKFDLVQPPLNFSLVSSGQAVSRVNHFGIEVESSKILAEWRQRLQDQSLVEKVEQAVDCCYATQEKVWLIDPDGNKWEVFRVLEQLPVVDSLQEGICCAPMCCTD